MDFFDDPNLFVGALEGLDGEGFPSGPSLVDELNLTTDFEPLQVEPAGPGKHQVMIPAASAGLPPQAMSAYAQQMGHYTGIKAHNPIGQVFHGPGAVGDGGVVQQQHSQYHSASLSQTAQPNGLYGNRSSPMWGNQDQNGNMYHPLPQQQQQQQPQPPQQQRLHQQHQIHNQTLHLQQQQTPQQRHLCHQQQRMQQLQQQQQQQQQSCHQQQLLNQRPHPPMDAQTLSLQQQHHSFPFHQGGHPQSQKQAHHNQQQVQQQQGMGGARFNSRVVPPSGVLLSKAYLEGQDGSLHGAPLQQQQHPQQSGYQHARGGQAFPGAHMEGPGLSFSIQASAMAHTLPACSLSSATAFQPSQYPAYPGEPDMPSLGQQSLPSPSVSRPAVPLTSTVPGVGCEFSTTPVMSQQQQQQPSQAPASQGAECPFRALRCSGQTQGSYNSSEMFGQAMSCYPSAASSQLLPGLTQSCGLTAVPDRNGCRSLVESTVQPVAPGGDFEGLEPPDLLPDLLPHLEEALSQHGGSNSSWDNGSQEKKLIVRNIPLVEYKEEKVMP